MIRLKLKELELWKTNQNRKPLILRGARQVGKTWLIKKFGESNFKTQVYVNFDTTPNLKHLFVQDYSIERIISVLEITSQTSIVASETLIIFDEIQEAEKGLNVLKYFCENAPQYHVVAAGSLLGVAMHKNESFPVGKVDFMDLQPMSFYEFLIALGEDKLAETLLNKAWDILHIFKDKLTDYLRCYLFTGGMPEAVLTYTETRNFEKVRNVHNNILLAYEADFSKHAPYEIIPRMRLVWQSIVSQLTKENKKFIYGQLRDGARAKDFELAIQWLVDAGLLVKCHRVSKPEIPLIAFQDLSAFKLYMLDVGLLLAMAQISSKIIIEGNALFAQFNGAIAEQYVLQQLHSKKNRTIYYWTNDRNTSEVDFILQTEDEIIPVEVKAGINLKAKSFKMFCEKFKPKTAIRTSLSDFKEQNWMINIPLWGIETL